MFWTKKKPECEHDWHELEMRNESTYQYYGIEVDIFRKDFAYVYCPKCDTQQRLYKEDWDLRKKAQEIKKQYKIQ